MLSCIVLPRKRGTHHLRDNDNHYDNDDGPEVECNPDTANQPNS